MPTFEEIYSQHADLYHALVMREDYQGNILPALQAIRPLVGLDVIEFGAGTGRLTRLLAPAVKTIHAFDASQHMLDIAIAQLHELGLTNWWADVADNRALPVADAVADLSIQGWSFGHYCGWFPDRWRYEIGKAVQEMLRVLRPEGVAIILETLGTGTETPQPPTDDLATYYAWLEDEMRFSSTWIRTDYRFESLEEAEQLTRFFFGDELADAVVENNWVILPECTGIWWRAV